MVGTSYKLALAGGKTLSNSESLPKCGELAPAGRIDYIRNYGRHELQARASGGIQNSKFKKRLLAKTIFR